MEYDLHHSIKTEVVLFDATAGASTVGAIIDTRGFESLEYAIQSGTITTGDFTFTLEEAPDDGTGNPGAFAAVPTELVLDASPVFDVDDDDITKRVGIIGKERFQRLTMLGANTPVGEFAIQAILSHPQTRPTAE